MPYYIVGMDSSEERAVLNSMRVIEKQTRVRFVRDTDNYCTQTPVNGRNLCLNYDEFYVYNKQRLRIQEKAGDFAG